MASKKVFALIDGFNLYHGIRNLRDNCLKWCNVIRLLEHFLRGEETLEQCYFYTAYPKHLSADIRNRYGLYVGALKTSRVNVVQGVFKRKERGTIIFHEEKETDVRIAVDLMDFAYMEKGDRFFIASADSDLLPAVERVLERFSKVSIAILLPPFQHAKNFKKLRQEYGDRLQVMKIKKRHIKNSRFPDKVGEVSCPHEYLES